MKKIASTILFLALFLSSSDAQGEFRFGFEASPSLSWLKTDVNTVTGNGSNLGFKLGLMGEKYFTESYALTFGIGFAFNQGGTLNQERAGNFWPQSELSNQIYNNSDYSIPPNADLKYHIQYVEIPFGFKMRTQEFGYLKYYAELPRFTLGIRTQARGDLEVTDLENTSKENVSQDVHLLNLSWGLGGGAEFSLNENTTIIGGIYYQNGMFDTTKNKNTKVSVDDNMTPNDYTDDVYGKEDSKAKLNVLTLRLGVIF